MVMPRDPKHPFDPSRVCETHETLDPLAEPFLRDHALNGIPLMPAVIGLEKMTQAAQSLWKDYHGIAQSFLRMIGDASFEAPLKFYRGRSRQVTWQAKETERPNEDGLYAASLRAEQQRFGRLPETIQHFTVLIHLGDQPYAQEASTRRAFHIDWPSSQAFSKDEIYHLYFHGPSFQVLDGVLPMKDLFVGRLDRGLSGMLLGDPQATLRLRMVELCLQTAGIWEMAVTGILALPRKIKQITYHGLPPAGTAVYALVRPRLLANGRPRFDAQVTDESGRMWVEVKDYRTIPLPYSLEAEKLAPLKAWMKGNSRGHE